MKTILLSKLRALGDTALLSATLEETRRIYPKEPIHLLIPEAWKDLYAHDPRPNRVWTFDTRLRGLKRVKEFFSLASRLRQVDFDISLGCHANPTSSWLGFLSGAQTRAHHNHNFLEENKFGNIEIPDKKVLKPFIERDLAVLEALGHQVNKKVPTRLFISENQKQEAQAEIVKLGLKQPLLMLGLGASRPTKVWPIEYFTEVSKMWQEKTGGSVFSLVSSGEIELAHRWKNGLGGSDFVVGSHYSVSQMMGLISECALFLGNDSGPRHVAVALGRPTLTLYGPQDPFECHPYNSDLHPFFFRDNLKCRPHTDLEGKHPWCGIQTCDVEAHKCMREIKAQDVAKKALDLYLYSRK